MREGVLLIIPERKQFMDLVPERSSGFVGGVPGNTLGRVLVVQFHPTYRWDFFMGWVSRCCW